MLDPCNCTYARWLESGRISNDVVIVICKVGGGGGAFCLLDPDACSCISWILWISLLWVLIILSSDSFQ